MAHRHDIDDEGQDLAWVEDNRSDDGRGDMVDDQFRYPSAVCCMCEGYYGPCFDEYVCATCHVFLFPEDIEVDVEANFSEVSFFVYTCLVSVL